MIGRSFSSLVLAFAIFTSLATSTLKHFRNMAPGTYQVESDCPNAQKSGQLTVAIETEQVTLTIGTDYGFPTNILNNGEYNDDKGGLVTSEGAGRSCRAMVWDTEAISGIFVCYRGEELECTINMKRIGS